jgi:hypothetical protein
LFTVSSYRSTALRGARCPATRTDAGLDQHGKPLGLALGGIDELLEQRRLAKPPRCEQRFSGAPAVAVG